MAYLLYTLVLAVMFLASSSNAKPKDEAMVDVVQKALEECMKDTKVTEEMFTKWKDADKGIDDDHCLFACVLKKTDAMNDKGMLDIDVALKKMEDWKEDDEGKKQDVALFEKCRSVNDEKLSDDEKGCARGLLLINCLHKAMNE